MMIRRTGHLTALAGAVAVAASLVAPACLSADMVWSDTQPLPPNAGTDTGRDYDPRLATDGAGHWICVWHSNDTLGGTIDDDFDILMARSEDNGATWVGPIAIDPLAATDAESDFHPEIATDGNGRWIVAWYTSNDRGSGPDPDILFSVSDDNGASWSTPAFLNSSATTDGPDDGDYARAITADGSGRWMVVWDNAYPGGEGSIFDVFVAASTNGVDWSDGQYLSDDAPNPGDDRGCDIVTDGNGTWIASWYSDNLVGTTGIGEDTDIHFTRSTDFGETWSPVAALNTTAATDTYRDVNPRIATDGQGNWVCVWEFKYAPDVSDPGDYDIYVATSTNGADWTPPEILNTNGTGSGYDWYPTIDTDKAGNWVVVWESRDHMDLPGLGVDRDILFSRSTNNGADWSPATPLNDYAFSDLSSDDWEPWIVHAGDGYWMTAWYSVYDLGGGIGADRDIVFATSCFPLRDGDHDCDGDVDLYDFAAFQSCFAPSGPVADGCHVFDFEGDADVDLDDFGVFVSEFAGPGG